MSRIIKFLPDAGNILKIEADNGINLGQFADMVTEQGGNLNIEKQYVTDKASKASYATRDAILPDGDIAIFAVPKNAKGNAEMSRKEIYAEIKSIVALMGDDVKSYFAVDGKNYTQVDSDTLEKKIKTYKKRKDYQKALGGEAPSAPTETSSSKKSSSKKSSSKAATKVDASSNEDAELIAARKNWPTKPFNAVRW